MSETNNDNVSVNGSLNPNDNSNNNDIYNASRNAERIAYALVDKFHAKGSFEFYCKVAYALPEHKIWKLYERATTSKGAKNPAGLFNWLCKREGV